MQLFLIISSYGFIIWLMFETAYLKSECRSMKFITKIQNYYIKQTQRGINDLNNNINRFDNITGQIEEIVDPVTDVLNKEKKYKGFGGK